MTLRARALALVAELAVGAAKLAALVEAGNSQLAHQPGQQIEAPPGP